MSHAKEPGLRVLVVEDNPADARLVQLALEESDIPFTVQVVTTLAQALEAAQKGVAVAVLDLNLPDSAGLETAERFRAAHPEVAVVVVTGTSDRDLGVQALRLGVHEYIAKNAMEPEMLERRLMIAMERVRMQPGSAPQAGALHRLDVEPAHIKDARLDVLRRAKDGPWVVASLNTPAKALEKDLARLKLPRRDVYIIAAGPRASTALGLECLADDHTWEDLALAIERACRRMGADATVVLDSWSPMVERYGADGAAELVGNLAYRFVVLGVQGSLLVEEGTTFHMTRPE